MTFAFIRHGQTDWNRDLRLQGSSDIPLNDTGRQQARDAVAMLSTTQPGQQGAPQTQWDAIVSSPLSRARETAQIVADGLGISLGPSYDLLVERHYGEAEGATDDVVEANWPDHEYPGLESLDDVVARGIAALDLIADDYGDANVVIVCHGTIIRYTLAALAGQPIDSIQNGSTATFDRLGEGWRVHTVNDELLLPA